MKKINIITTLVNRAQKIYSKETFDIERTKIKEILSRNGYPERLVATIIDNKIKSCSAPSTVIEGPQKAPVYMKLPYIGNVSEVYSKRIKFAVTKCFGSQSTHTPCFKAQAEDRRKRFSTNK